MHEYPYPYEIVRVALIMGVVVSIVFYERVQLTTGGAIVPAYLTLFLPRPLFILVTVGFGYLTYLVVNRGIGRRVILYGRRKFEVELLVGLALIGVGTLVALRLQPVDDNFAALLGIGFLVPGVLAHDMARQRPSRTVIALAATVTILVLIMFVFVSVLRLSPADGYDKLQTIAAAGYAPDLLLVGVIVSVVSGLVVFATLGLRAGGFVTAAYLALAFNRPWDILFSVAVAGVTWVVVTKLIMPNLLIFGRRKLSTMLLVGGLLAWVSEVVVRGLTGYHPWVGFSLITLVIPALLANDAQRQGVERTLWGTAISSLAVYGVMNLVSPGLLAIPWA